MSIGEVIASIAETRIMALAIKFFVMLFLPAIAYAQIQSSPTPGVYASVVFDSTRIAGGKSDTSRSVVKIFGADMFGYMAQYGSVNDSINVEVYADFSADGYRWFHTSGLDTMIVSGTADTTRVRQIEIPTYPIYARCRVKALAASSDTVAVRIVWLVHYLGLQRLY